MKPMATGDVTVMEAAVSRTIGQDYRMRIEIAVGEKERIVIADCSFDVFKLTTSLHTIDGANRTTMSTIRYFEPDSRITLRTIGSPRVNGFGPVNPSFSAIGFQ
jgi:hypothetical protein